MLTPLSIPFVFYFEGELGVYNRKFTWDDKYMWFNVIIWAINVSYFTPFNQQLWWTDLVFFDLLYIMQKIVIAIKYAY